MIGRFASDFMLFINQYLMLKKTRLSNFLNFGKMGVLINQDFPENLDRYLWRAPVFMIC